MVMVGIFIRSIHFPFYSRKVSISSQLSLKFSIKSRFCIYYFEGHSTHLPLSTIILLFCCPASMFTDKWMNKLYKKTKAENVKNPFVLILLFAQPFMPSYFDSVMVGWIGTDALNAYNNINNIMISWRKSDQRWSHYLRKIFWRIYFGGYNKHVDIIIVGCYCRLNIQ